MLSIYLTPMCSAVDFQKTRAAKFGGFFIDEWVIVYKNCEDILAILKYFKILKSRNRQLCCKENAKMHFYL